MKEGQDEEMDEKRRKILERGNIEGKTPEEVLRDLREAEFSEEDRWFKPHRYNDFSREPILFFKALNNRMLKW